MNAEKILDNFSTHLKNVIARAISVAASLEHREVSPLHLLFAVSDEVGSVGAEILLRIKFDTKQLTPRLEAKPKTGVFKRQMRGAMTATLPALNAGSKKVLERAMLLAFQRVHRHVGTEHLLHALVQQKDADIEAICQAQGINQQMLLEEMEIILQSTSHFPDTDEVRETLARLNHLANLDSSARQMEDQQLPAALPGGKSWLGKTQPRSSSSLSLFTVNLTDQERAKQTDPVIGRKKEIERLIHILARRTKNNPVLVGEAGVGKTAIVEGLAKRIVTGDVPDVLKRKQILALDLTLLISGTIYRGEFEARLKQVIDGVAANEELILFIDELHNIIGAGSNGGTMDAANILKPALARGQLRCIGATTIDEYAKYITSDSALERRFQAIHVAEPSLEEARAILQGIKPYYENFHRVRIIDEAIEAAVEFGGRYLHENFLPDKAIDLMDEAAAAVRSARPSSPAERRELELEQQLTLCRQQKEEVIRGEQFDQALVLKQREAELAQALQSFRHEKRHGKPTPRIRVTKRHVAKVLGERLGIPVDYLLQDDWERLEHLPAQLEAEIIGQAHIIERVAQALRHAHLRLGKERKPFASFLFVGPSGVGKTELATVLAKALYHDDQSLIRLDMSEFSEAHGVSKLLGSPAGYIGYKERNRFTDTMRRRPYSVVLFDEFDKAHPDVQKLLLQILDSGELTDSHGKKLHFHQAVVILTASIGVELYRSEGIGFGSSSRARQTVNEETERVILQRVKELLGNDLVSRIQSTCFFAPLSPDHVQSIVRQHIDTISQQLQIVKQLRIIPDAKALKSLASRAYTHDTGVRHVDHVIQQVIYELLTDILQKQWRKKQYTLTQVANAYKLV